LAALNGALEKSNQAAAVRRGLRVTIAGAPNVGKSSLLNALVGRDAAIVSETAGTTRDVVEVALIVGGVPVSICDTAGLRDHSDDAIEREGMVRSKAVIEQSDILIWVSALGQFDLADVALPPRKPDLHIVNKSDLLIHQRNDSDGDGELLVSVLNGTGIKQVKVALESLISTHTQLQPDAIVVRERHRQAISESIRYLNDANAGCADELELVAENVRKAAQCLECITGRIGVEDFLGRIFQEFCIGK
jgi:tRNA modification GTPase